MPTFGEFSFARPELFLLLVAFLPAAWCFFRSRKREGILLRGEGDYRRAFGAGRLLRLAIVASVLLSFASIVAILARPEVSERRTTVSKEGIDIAIVLDLSKSMLAEDMAPNRIGAAKEVIKDFLGRLDGDRVGIVLFAGKPFVSVPLSFDYGGVAAMVGRITTDSIDQNAGIGLQGTAMGDGILAAVNMLERARQEAVDAGESPRERVIVAMTDGEANVGLDPNVAAKLAAEKRIRIHTVGIGKEWTPLVMTDENGEKHPFLDQLGNPLIATLDRDTLENVAKTTEGKTFYASDAGSLDKVFSTLAALERRSAKTESTLSHRSFVWPFVALLAISAAVCLASLRILAVSSPIRAAERTYSVRTGRRTARVAAAGASVAVMAAMVSPFAFGFGEGTADGRSVLWIVDVSKSMDARDVSDDPGESRLERAKKLVSDAMGRARGSEQGLAVFAGDSVLVSPMTRDTDTLLAFVAGLDSSAVAKGGTDLAGALSLGSRSSASERPSAVVLLTDGWDPGDTDADAMRKSIAAMPAVLLVGLGSAEGAPIPSGTDPFGGQTYAQYRWERVVSRLNAELLAEAAKAPNVTTETNPDSIVLPRAPGTGSYAGSADWNDDRVVLAWLLLPLWLATVFIPDTKRHE